MWNTSQSDPGDAPPAITMAPRDESRVTWDLLQPYLSNHRGADIPEAGYVRELLQLPRLRDFDWNDEWTSTHPFIDTKPRDISALIMQLTGDPAPNPCTKCASGRGLFKSCIMLSLKAPSGPLAQIFCCANCFYHFGQTYCSHKTWRKERAKGAKMTAEARVEGSLNDFVASETLPSTEMETSDTRIFDIHDEDVEMNGQDPDLGLNDDDGTVRIPVGLEMAEPGRRYDMWPNDNGILSPLPGILLPGGYRLDTSDPVRPWVCPVTHCRKPFQRLKDFGFHFKRFHYAECLEDNGDGTFTVIRSYFYKKQGIGLGGKILIEAPAVVVSHKTQKVSNPDSGTTPLQRGETDSSLVDNAKQVWALIQPMIPAGTEIPRFSAFQDLLQLPVRRQLPREQIAIRENRDIAAIAIQLTGDLAGAVVPEYYRPCEKCKTGGGHWDQCVILSQNASSAARAQYNSCANCLLGGGQSRCSSRDWIKTRNQHPPLTDNMDTLTEEDIASETADQALARAPHREEKKARNPIRAAMRREEEAADRAFKRPRPFVPRQPEASRSSSYDMRTPVSASTSTAVVPQAESELQPQPQQQSQRQPRQPQPSSLMSQGTFHSSLPTLEMEEWEVAPGRILSSDGTHNIAFSSSFLTSSSTSVPILRGVSTRVCSIHLGQNMVFESDNNKTRQLLVSSGKVRVALTLGGGEAGEGKEKEEEFTIGPHGCVVVKPGAKCEVRNEAYVDAWVFVCEFGRHWGE
ncbi:hypothetical protein QBC44DRAFT_295513 [Cladorrhinum sp. PSN332]|nr:hypothetical protein QBC44DRAFT_295513 [Cladorrhinum sp. PSN332]